MASESLITYVRQLRRTIPAENGGECSDAELVRRFVEHRDDAAFTLLLERHGPMVWGVCRRKLATVQDAEDVFQAVFLVLLKKAAALKKGEWLGGWLYGVACRTAKTALRRTARRRRREQKVAAARGEAMKCEELWTDVGPILDEEIQRLPEKYRLPLVLCDLQGLTQSEAAQRVGWPEGTVSGRLFRARQMLQTRLLRRGVSLSATALVALLEHSANASAVSQNTVTAALTAARALRDGAIATISHSVWTLVQIVGGELNRWKWKTALSCVMFLIASTAITATVMLSGKLPEDVRESALPPKEPSQPKSAVRKDQNGDPLPSGALVRLGTLKMRYPGYARMALTPDGKRMFAIGANKQLHFLDPTTGNVIKQFDSHEPWGSCLAMSPDGKLLATGGADKKVGLWDAAAGKLLRTMSVNVEQDAVRAVAYSPDGRLIAAASGMRFNMTQVFEVSSGNLLRVLKRAKPTGIAIDVAFLPGGKRLAVAEDGGLVSFWDIGAGNELFQYRTKEFTRVTKLAVSTNGKYLVLAGNHQQPNLYVFDLSTGNLIRKYQQSNAKALPPAFVLSPDGLRLIRALPDGDIEIRDLATGKLLRTFSAEIVPGYGGIWHMAISENGRTLATSTGSSMRIWDLATGREKIPTIGHHAPVYGLDVSPDGKIIATGSHDSSIMLWQRDGGTLIRRIPQPGGVGYVRFVNDGKWLIADSMQRALGVWKAATGKQVRIFGGTTQPLSHYRAISPDGTRLAAADQETQKKIYIWNIKNGKQLSTITTRVRVMAFSPDAKKLATIGEDNLLRYSLTIWDTATGKQIARFPAPIPPSIETQPEFSHMTFLPDGRTIAVVFGSQHGVRFWETATGKERFFIPATLGCYRPAMAMSPNGKMLALGSCGPDTKIYLWDLLTVKKIGTLDGHQDMVTALTFAPDGRYLISTSGDTTGLVWDVALALKKN